MNRLVLIGNGFDLAHGLKTNYRDFVFWYWDQWGSLILQHNKRTDKAESINMDKEKLLNGLYECDELFKYLHMLTDEMAFEFETGNKEYVIDVDLMNSVCFMESFKNEYPSEYEAFMKTFVGLKKDDIATFFKEDADLLTKLLKSPGN